MNAMSEGESLLPPQLSSRELAAWFELSARAAGNVDSVVSSIIATCQDVDAALTPIIGPRGVAALFNRSIQLAGLTQPLLAGTQSATPTTMDLALLKAQLAGQDPAEAAAAGAALLHTFQELLGTLIGVSLTEQLLHRVWSPMLGGQSQDPKP